MAWLPLPCHQDGTPCHTPMPSACCQGDFSDPSANGNCLCQKQHPQLELINPFPSPRRQGSGFTVSQCLTVSTWRKLVILHRRKLRPRRVRYSASKLLHRFCAREPQVSRPSEAFPFQSLTWKQCSTHGSLWHSDMLNCPGSCSL